MPPVARLHPFTYDKEEGQANLGDRAQRLHELFAPLSRVERGIEVIEFIDDHQVLVLSLRGHQLLHEGYQATEAGTKLRFGWNLHGGLRFLQRIGHIGRGEGNRALLFPVGQFEELVQSLLKLAIAHLLEDVGIPRLVDLEGFVAVGADDFVHGEWNSFVGRAAIRSTCCRSCRGRDAGIC